MAGDCSISEIDMRLLLLIMFLVEGIWTFKSQSVRLIHSRTGLFAEASSDREAKKIGLYVHIPFCRRRCRYCNFAIVPVGPDESEGFRSMNENYTAALLRELDNISSTSPRTILLDSVYFGGGTPSLAPISTLQEIIDYILRKDSPFVLKEGAELTIEMDPGTFDLSKLKAVRGMGFNRISLGIQSFNDTILESLGRFHRVRDIEKSVKMIAEVFGEDMNYSIDLISGLPGLSLAQWAETLQIASSLTPRPLHMSIYDLQVESGTVFGSWYDEDRQSSFHATKGESPVAIPILPTDEEASFMYKFASGYLRSKGYEHYEVSSYAIKGHRSRHNQIYWDASGEWYAIGLGATSFVNSRMQSRPRALADYIEWSRTPDSEADDEIDDFEYLMDVVLKRLRTSEGLSLEWVRSTFPAYIEAILKGAQLGIDLGLASVENGFLKLSDPAGFLFSNSIISSIFVELDEVHESLSEAIVA